MKQIRKIVYPGIETGKKKKQSSRGILQKGVLRNFTKLTGKHLCQSFFFNKVPGLRPATLLKRRIWYRCFPVNFVKFLRTPLDDCFWRQIFYAMVEAGECENWNNKNCRGKIVYPCIEAVRKYCQCMDWGW